MIKNISHYGEDELQLLRKFSPAISRYLEILSRHKSSRLEAWVECGLATYFKTAPAKEVCLHWSERTDEFIKEKAREFKISENNLAVFAMGKLGAKELNLSSDIDLVIMTRSTPSPEQIQITRNFVKSLSQSGEFGPGYRVDLDLRPGGVGSPIVTSINLFQDYYWTQSELWERMALVRLRPICGESSLISDVIEARDQFCYRKYLDYSLLEEFKRLRPKIHATALNSANSTSINLKLAPGFIRDIEIFVNAHQIIYGGKDKSLRTTSTELSATHLRKYEKEAGLFESLLKIYWEYRQWENQIQAINDFQTHSLDLKQPPPGWSWPSSEELKAKSHYVDTHISELLGAVTPIENSVPSSLNIDLKKMGFSETSINEVWPEVIKASVLSRQKEIDEQKRTDVIVRFIEEISISAFDKDLGLLGLKDFLSSIRAKATFFHLLSKEQKLIKDLSFLFGLSPYLGSLFSTRPELIDAFLFNQDDEFSTNLEVALVQMAERKRIAEVKSALSFFNHQNLNALTQTLSDVADSICVHLIRLTEKEVGCDPIDLLALGKWGGRELGFKSDLDFIFVSKGPPSEEHHRFVRRLVSRLRDPSVGGAIYSIDTRLRPSSQGGALIVQERNLFEFLEKALPWEKQAYLKARWVTRDEIFQNQLSFKGGLTADEIDELKVIKSKLVQPLVKNSISLKYSKGAIVDIELALQAIILKNSLKLENGSTSHFFEVVGLKDSFLNEHYLNLRKLEQLSRVLTNDPDPEFSRSKPFVGLIAKITKLEPDQLIKNIELNCQRAIDELEKIDPTFS